MYSLKKRKQTFSGDIITAKQSQKKKKFIKNLKFNKPIVQNHQIKR